jgi:hypothetical protein
MEVNSHRAHGCSIDIDNTNVFFSIMNIVLTRLSSIKSISQRLCSRVLSVPNLEAIRMFCK